MDAAKRITILNKESLEITNKKGQITVVDGPCVVTVVQDKIFTLRKVIHYSKTYKIVQYTDGNDIHIRGPTSIPELSNFMSNNSTNCVSLGVGETSHGIVATHDGLIVQCDISAVYMRSIHDRLVTVSAHSRNESMPSDDNTSPTQLISALDASSLKSPALEKLESKACPGGMSQTFPKLTTGSLEIKSLTKAHQAFSEALLKIGRSHTEEKVAVNTLDKNKKLDVAPGVLGGFQ